MVYVILYMMLYNTLYNVILVRCIQKINVFKKLANRWKFGILSCSKNTLDLNITTMKAIIYARVSSAGDRQSTTRQVADLTKYAKFKEYEVVRIFEEHASGGKKNSERPILLEAINFCIKMNIDTILVTELSRIGRNAFEVLQTINILNEHHINIYFDKEQFTLLDENGKPSTFAPILIATLATCAQLERENIAHRLNSGYNQYRANGGKVGRKPGSIKPVEKLKEEYKDVIKELEKGESIRRTAKLHDVSISTVQRIKKLFSL